MSKDPGISSCENCRYWSDTIARANAEGVQAMCLCGGSQKRGAYTYGHELCDKWAAGEPVDRIEPEKE